MSKLEFVKRPLVRFDPANQEHRRHYAQYLKTRGWGSCPVRFVCPDEVGQSLPAMIHSQLMTHYLTEEFQDPELEHALTRPGALI